MRSWIWLLVLLVPLAVRAQELPVAPDDTLVELPPFPGQDPSLEPLMLSPDGLWVRDRNRFALLRRGALGWADGTWLLSPALPGSQLVQRSSGAALYRTHFGATPVLVDEEGRPRLRMRVTDHGIESVAMAPVTPDDIESCDVNFETRASGLWLRAGSCFLDATPNARTLHAEDGSFAPVDMERTQQPWLGIATPALSALTLAGTLTASWYATPSSPGLALGRTLTATLLTQPAVALLIDASAGRTVMHLGHGLHYAAAILLSPLPAAANTVIGAIGDDGATHRGRGFAAAFGATLVSTSMAVPLTTLLVKHVDARWRPYAQPIAMALIGFASSVSYSYAAGL